MDTYGTRKTAHVFGAVSLDSARSTFQFAHVFNGTTFHDFLRLLVQRYSGRKIFLIIDNGPCHRLHDAGQAWLRANRHAIELFRLPPYSPEFMPMEGVWKATRKIATHNRFFVTTDQRDVTLRRTFAKFQQRPSLIAAHVERFQ